MFVTGEFNEVGYSTISVGESSFTSPGTYSWTVPADVDSITAVAVGGGGGGGGAGSSQGKGGGGGGALAYVNHISVTPGETLTVGVGTSGQPGIVPTSTASDGGNSYVKRGAISLVEAGGGKKGNDLTLDGNNSGGLGGTVIVGAGGSGGRGGSGTNSVSGGGGGAGGYSGSGGGGGADNSTFDGSGGGAGGGFTNNIQSQGGGGVGILGQGANGIGGAAADGLGGGGGGSGGQDGVRTPSGGSLLLGGGNFGGGGGGGADAPNRNGNVGGVGAVRIIWGLGAYRQFPATNVGVLTETYAKAGVSGLGTYTALEFIENIGTATTLTANVFAPYDPVYDEFAGVLFGPGQGTFMRQEDTGKVIVYNEIDEFALSMSYGIIPQLVSIDEGGTITFTIITTNVPNGTEIYYEIV
jgi:hypothetical protein